LWAPAAPQARALAQLGAEVVAAPLAVGHDAAWRAAFFADLIIGINLIPCDF